MIGWIVSLALPYLVKTSLAKLGVSAAVSALIAPRIVKIINDVADVAKEAVAKGASDEQAAEAADRIVLDPRSPDHANTLNDILHPKDNV